MGTSVFPRERWRGIWICRKYGYEFVELLAERKHNPLNPIWSIGGVKKILENSQRFNLKIYSSCLDYIIDNGIIKSNKIDEANLNYTLNYIESVSKLGIKIVILPLMEQSSLNKFNLEKTSQFVFKVAKYAEKFNIKIALESIASPNILLDLLKK